ncbi:MAG: hypothetical protein AAGA87_16250 [Pseudomonadota bacterium]
MAETSLYFILFLLVLYLVLRVMRVVRAHKQKRKNERLKAHLNWQQHPRKPAV